jgi:hypothetical protein
MITQVEDWARASGIQEGDTLISLAGATVKKPAPERVAAWATKRLQVMPGEDVKAIWIRPGTGRMEGVIRAGAPQRTSVSPSVVPPAPKEEPVTSHG